MEENPGEAILKYANALKKIDQKFGTLHIL
jgi:hypothetical protein